MASFLPYTKSTSGTSERSYSRMLKEISKALLLKNQSVLMSFSWFFLLYILDSLT